MTKTALQFTQQGWTQQAYARDKHGVEVCSTSDDAVCWCSIGAIGAVYGTGIEHIRALGRLKEVVGNGTDIVCWNDDPDRTKEEVIEAFVKAGI